MAFPFDEFEAPKSQAVSSKPQRGRRTPWPKSQTSLRNEDGDERNFRGSHDQRNRMEHWVRMGYDSYDSADVRDSNKQFSNRRSDTVDDPPGEARRWTGEKSFRQNSSRPWHRRDDTASRNAEGNPRISSSATGRESVPMATRLRELEQKQPNEVMMALVSPRSGFIRLYQFSKIKDEQLEQLVRILEIACRSEHSPHSLSSLLQSINDSGFIRGPLTEYITRKSIMHSCMDLPCEFIVNLIEITKSLMHHLPSHSSGNVTSLLSQLNLWVSRYSSDSQVSFLKECLTVVEDMRQDIVKAIRGGDVVRDQDGDDKLDEEPPDDFRKIPVMPTAAEIKSDEPPFLRKNIVFGAYKTVDHYLDIQYRLLREDFVCPLREGLKMLLFSKEKNMPLKKISDIRFYNKVQILTPYCTKKEKSTDCDSA